MAKPIRKIDKTRRRSFREEHLPLTRQNYVIMGVGLLVIAAGYFAMYVGSVEGFLSLVLAPILLVLGYCVVIPYGILHKQPDARKTGSQLQATP